MLDVPKKTKSLLPILILFLILFPGYAKCKNYSPICDVLKTCSPKKDIATTSIPTGLVKHLKIAGQKVPLPKTLGDFPSFFQSIHQQLEKHETSGIVNFTYGKEISLRLKVPYLGKGHHGIVYEILNSSSPQVIKIPRPRMISPVTLISEREVHNFWKKKSQKRTFMVPQEIKTHPLGLFRIMQKIEGETLTKTLLRFGAIKISNLSTKITRDNHESITGVWKDELEKINQALKEINATARKKEEYFPSMAPNNIYVTYKNSQKCEIANIYLIDIGPDLKNSKKYWHTKDLSSYLNLAANRLFKYLTSAEYLYDHTELLQIEKNRRKYETHPKKFGKFAACQ